MVILSFVSAFNEREQVGIDDVGLRRDHAMRIILVRLQRSVLAPPQMR